MKAWGAGRKRRAVSLRARARKPTAEQIFKSRYPHATIERQKPVRGKTYYLVRRELGGLPVDSGPNKERAWANAVARLDMRGLADKKEPARCK